MGLEAQHPLALAVLQLMCTALMLTLIFGTPDAQVFSQFLDVHAFSISAFCMCSFFCLAAWSAPPTTHTHTHTHYVNFCVLERDVIILSPRYLHRIQGAANTDDVSTLSSTSPPSFDWSRGYYFPPIPTASSVADPFLLPFVLPSYMA